MDPSRRLLVNTLTATMIGFAACAHAQPAVTEVVPAVVINLDTAAAERSVRHAMAQAQIDDAVGALEQATLQRDFASNARELGLLQRAHDRLSAAAKQLDGARRAQTIDLLADLDHSVERASSHLGPLASPDGGSFDPRAPSRNQLAQLATEGQDLQRSTPAAHRLLDGSGLGSTSRLPTVGDRQSAAQIWAAPANADLLSWPAEMRATWPQIDWPF
jgi:hypothetical protein